MTRAAIALVGALLLWTPAFGQDPAAARGEPFLLEEIHPPQITEIDPANRVVYLLGGVAVRVGGMEIRCDHLIVWLGAAAGGVTSGEEAEAAEPPALDAGRHVARLYAEGAVWVREKERSLRASELFLDLEAGRGILLDVAATLAFRRGRREATLALRADELRLLTPERLEALDARVSTVPFAVPLFWLGAEQVEVIREDRGQRVAKNLHYRSSGNALRAGGVPVFWFPDIAGDSVGGQSFRYIDSVSYRRSNRFGHEPELVLGDDILVDGERWGHWSVLGAWLSKRGLGTGVGLDYATQTYQGRLRTRYQRDHGIDRAFGRPSTRNRGRVSWYHRHRLPEDVQIDLELNLFSDRGYYPTYEEEEFFEAKPPENLIFLQKRWSRSRISALVLERFNDFFTRTGSLPEVRYDLSYEPLLDIGRRSVYLSTTARLGQKTRRPERGLDLPAGRSIRADLETLIEAPIGLGPLEMTPFAGVRYTFYQRDLARRERHRVGFTQGVSLAAQAWRNYEAEGGPFQLDGLRHVMYPVVTFRNTTGIRVRPDELIPFDEVESARDEQALEFRLRNLLQTRDEIGGTPTLRSVFDLDTRIAWHPNPRDNGGRPFGTLDVDLILGFSPELSFATDFEVDWYGGGFEVLNAAVAWLPRPDLELMAGFRHYEDTYSAVFGQFSIRLEEKWMIQAETSYDFEKDRGLEHRFHLYRIAAESVFELALHANLLENDFGIGVSFTPRFLFDPYRRSAALGREARSGFIGTGLGH